MGRATQITRSHHQSLGGDSRGISDATFTPDGQFVMRSTNDFWGGLNQLAWKIDRRREDSSRPRPSLAYSVQGT